MKAKTREISWSKSGICKTLALVLALLFIGQSGFSQALSPGSITLSGTNPVCKGKDPGIINSSVAGSPAGDFSYQWQTESTPGNWTNIPATGSSFDPGILNTTTSYRRLVIYNADNSITAASNIITIAVTDVSAPLANTTQFFCSAANPAISNLSATGTGLKWYNTEFGGVELASTTPLVNGATYYVSQTANGCESLRTAVTTTIYQTPTVTATPLTQTQCTGSLTNIALTSNVTGTVFNWTVVQTDLSGAAAGSGTSINQILNTTGNVQGKATYTITPTANGCAGSSLPVVVSVNTKPQIISQVSPAASKICTDETASFTVNISGSPQPAIQWQESANGSTWSDIPGATSNNYSFIAQANQKGFRYRTVLTNACGTLTSNEGILDVSPPISIKTQPTSTAICNGGTAVFFAEVIGQQTFTVTTWQISNDGGITWVNVDESKVVTTTTGAANGVFLTTLTLNPTLAESGTKARVVFTNNCPVYSNEVGLTVTALPANPIVTGANRCGAGSVLLTAQPPAGSTIDWYDVASGGSPVATGTNSFSTPNLTSTTTYYAVSRTLISGCLSDRVPVTATIKNIPSASVNNVTICNGSSATLTVTTNATSPVIAWTPIAGSLSTITVSPNTSTSYNVTVTDGISSCQITASGTVYVNATPVAPTAPSPVLYCMGATTTALTASGAGGNQLRWYTSATGGTPLASAPIPSTASTGTVSYWVSQVNNNNCEGPRTKIDVVVNGLPAITTSPSTSICSGESTTLTASGATSYSWVPTSNLSSTTGNTVVANPTSTTTYSVTGTDANGCSNSANIIITVNSLPSITLGNQTICLGSSATLTASTNAASPTYSWTPTGQVSSSITVSPTTSTNYTVNVTNGLTGCARTASAIVTINPPATSVAGPPQTICAGEDISLSGFASGSAVWTTSGNGSFSPGANKLDAVYTPGPSDISSGAVSLTLTTADPDGSGPCTTVSSTVVMTINPLVTVNAGSPQSVCAGNSISLAGNIQGGTSSGTWTASSGSFSDPNALNPTYTPAITSGTVTLMLTSNDPPGPCGPVSATVVITVNPRPAANVSVSTLCSGSTATIKATPVAGNLLDFNYTWTVPSGATAPGNVTTFSATIPGTYTVILTNKITNCASVAASGTLTSNPLLGDPIVVNNSRCGTGTVVLSATADVNEVVDWYNDPTTTTKLFTGNTYTTTSLSAPTVRIYYVEARHATLGCKSARVPVVATVYAIPPAPVVTDGSTCGPGTVTLSASGCTNGTYNWYAASSGGTSLFTGSSYSPVVSTTTSFWVSCTNANNCEGPRAEVVATVIPITPGIIGADQVKCSGGDPDMLVNLQTGTGGSGSAITYQWQASIGGGAWSPITGATGLTYDPPAGITAGTSYRRIITSVKNGTGGYTCTLPSNVVTVNVNPLPSITPAAIPNICLGTTSAILSYTNATNGGNKYSITWNASAISAGFINLVNADLTPGQISIAVPTTATTTTYTGVLVVSNSNTGCQSSSYPISITINPLPVCTITGNNNICPASTNTYSAPSGMTSYNWNITGNGTITGSTISNSVSVTSGATCGTFTLSLTITNANGCTNTCTATFTVADIVKPVVSGTTTIPSLGCNPPDPTTAFIAPNATDNCNTPTLKIGYPVTSSVSAVGCTNTQTRTWIFVDACGNESIPFVQTISWTSDIVKPVITGITTIPFLGCNPPTPAASFVAPTATDNCGTPVLKFGYPITQPVVTTGCNNEQSRTWIFVDACGNESDPFTQKITWTTDLTKPVVTGTTTIPYLGCNPANPLNAFVAPTATDDCGIPVLKSGYPITSTVVTVGCANTQTRTWIFVDVCGNESTPFVQTISWTSDLVKPVLTGIATIPSLGCNPASPTASFIAPTVTENCGTVILKSGYPITSAVTTTNCNNTQTRTWIYVDRCGNESDPFTQTITWTSDQVKPVVTGLTSIPNLGCNPVDPTSAFIAPSATDNCGTPIMKAGYPITSTVTTVNCVSIQTRTWIFVDGCGNESDPFMQTVIWTTDQTKPIVTCPAAQIFCISPNNIYSIPALTATDNCSNVTVTYVVSGATNRSGSGTDASGILNIGTSTITWTVTDGCNNFITCATTVTVNDETLPLFNAIAPICVGSSPIALPNTSTNGITGTWSPSTINTGVTGTTTYIFTPSTGLCASNTSLDITIRAKDIPTFNAIGPLCKGSIPPALPTVSVNNIVGTWNAAISTATSGKKTYTFTPATGECATTATIEVKVDDPVIPAFDPVGPFCKGSTAPVLPLTSKNNITGTWDKAINTALAGKTMYTFTPTAGQCAVSTTIEIEIADQVTPTFDIPGPYCIGAIPNALLLTSKNGIKGTWSPAVVSTAAVGISTYTFTPDAGQCGIPAVISIEVTSKTIPDFDPVGPFCKNATVFPLPVKSKNNVTGTWNKAISTATSGKTIYSFTPATGQCATTSTLEVEILEPNVPDFDPIVPYCKNAIAAALPITSKNNIAGTWDKSVSTALVGKTTYTFTPAAGLCATSTTIEIEVTEPLVPLFDAVGPYCKNASATALPSSSKNGITGTWDKAVSTSVTGKSTYLFTPTPGQCATTATLDIQVNEPVTPTFNSVGPYCKDAVVAALPSSSTNGISGTWDKSLNTANVGKTTYTFTPAPGQCAVATIIEVEIADQVLPVFNAIGPYCVGATATALPTISQNGISGAWDKAISTATAGKTSYTFTPAAGQCGAPVTIEIIVNSKTIPTFDPIALICKGTTPSILPSSSKNGISGTWNKSISTATAGKSIYTFTPTAGQCATDATLEIEITEPILTAFDPIGNFCKGSAAGALATTSNNGVSGNWDKAINTSALGKTMHLFTPTTGQCATNASLEVIVTDLVIPTFDPVGPYCKDATVANLPPVSKNNITGIWDKALTTSSVGKTTYTFTPAAGQCAVSTTIEVEIADQVLPVFVAVGPYCVGATATALPTISQNGISGTWDKAISTATAGKTTYTFTPAAGQCGAPISIDVEVKNNIIPTFNAIGPFCKGEIAPALPTTSNNGISGTWDKTISTAVTGKFMYTFTPAPVQCAINTSIEIEVMEPIIPIFDLAGPYCKNAVVPVLPAISKNNITGTWNKALSTTNVGKTIYTFTPAAGQCAATTTLEVDVTDIVIPTFDPVGPYCKNATAAALPTTSKNNITGTWDKVLSTSNVGITTYTFTPAAGQCATATNIDVEIADQVTPTFSAFGPYCKNATPALLSSTSNNGIKGSWTPAIISTTAIGKTTYTFAPNAGECGAAITIDIEVINTIIPTFDVPGPFCKGSTAAALATTSNNGISGTWDKIISTGNAGTTTYTFTPANNPCAVAITMDIIVTETVIPVFSVVGPYCQGSTPPALPGISNNGIKGAWNNAISTGNAGTTTYTFTPDPGQCSGTATMDVTIQPQVTPSFDKVGPYCIGASAAALPTISKNGILGTWNTAINTSIGGISTYTFTPSAGQCANLVTLDVEVNNEVTPVFDQRGPYCINAPANALPSISNNGIKGLWDKPISTSATGSTTYSFTPDPGQCGIPVTMTIDVTDKIVPTFDPVAPYCKAATPNALPKTSNNGIKGTWDKAVSTSVIGTATYLFTPDAGQCAVSATIEIVTENCCAVELTASATEINCTTSSSIITAIATKGKAPYEYALDGGSYQLGNTFSSGSGNFKITVKDASGCTAETFVTVTETISDLTATATAPEITCSENLGTITVNALKGNAPFAYAINGGAFQNGNAFANLPPGSYKITVKDATGCTTTLNADLNKTSSNPNLMVSDPASVCAPGTIDLTKSAIVAGSDPGLTYSYWTNPAATQPVNNANDIAQSGTYYIKAENSNGCIAIKPVKIAVLSKPILNVSDPASSCNTVDLTASAITSGSDKGLSFTYWSDVNATNALTDPDKITISGTYYIKASSSTGCSDIQPVQVTILALPALVISNPTPVCAPSVIDLTSSLVTAGSDAGLVFTYWKDDQATQKLTDPDKISNTGTYFIKGTSPNGCFAIKPVNAVVNSFPVLAVTEPAAVCFPATIDITAASVTKGSEAGLSLTYWSNSSATQTIQNPTNISQTATYYIKAATAAGCYDIKPVKLTIHALPIVSITDPAPVCSPLTIDLTAPAYTQGSDNNLVFSYWRDEKATFVMANPSKVDQSGTYYIKGTASTGCYVIRPIQVTINRLPTLNVINPPDACTPSTVDITWSSITSGSDGDLTYSYWTDRSATTKLNNPNAISESGTYFIKVVNSNSCTTVKEVQVVINPLPTLSIKSPDSLCIGLSTDISISFSGQAPWSFTYNDGSQNLVVNNIRSQPYLLRVEPKQTTTYTITSVSDRFCTNRNPENNKATIHITYPIPGIRHVPVTTTANTPVVLKGREIPGYKYNWDPRVGLNNPALARPTFNYNQLVEYKISMVSSAGCLTVDTMMVRVSNATVPDSPCDFFTPNVFSPNGDGRNDTYFPFTVNIISIKFFRIFNRWGELVFETKRFGEGWNGMYKGKKQPIDAYVWTAEAVCEDGTTVRQSGNVLLAK